GQPGRPQAGPPPPRRRPRPRRRAHPGGEGIGQVHRRPGAGRRPPRTRPLRGAPPGGHRGPGRRLARPGGGARGGSPPAPAPAAFTEVWGPHEEATAGALANAAGCLPRVTVTDAVLDLATGLCAELGAEGLRADLVLARGAAALAALDGRTEASTDDVLRLAP